MRGRTWAFVLCTAFGVTIGAFAPSLNIGISHLDLQLRPIARTQARVETIVVRIDRTTFDRLGVIPVGDSLPRGQVAHFVRLARRAGAKALLIDLLFSHPSVQDEELRAAIGESGRMRIGLCVEPLRETGTATDRDTFPVARPFVLPVMTPQHVTLAHPIPWDPDGIIRGFWLSIFDEDLPRVSYPHLAFVAKGQKFGAGVHQMRWAMQAPEVEFSEVMRSLTVQASLAGKVVILGATNQGQRLNDMQPTPVGEMSGIQVVNQAVQSLADPRPIAESPPVVDLAIGLALALLTTWLCLEPTWVRTLGALAVSLIGSWIISKGLLESVAVGCSILVPFSAALVAGLSALALTGIRYLPSWIRFGWRQDAEEIVALFVDIEDSTVLLGQVVGSERAFLEHAQRVIAATCDRHRGHIERSLGDGAFIVFRGTDQAAKITRCLATMRELERDFASHRDIFVQAYGVTPNIVQGAELAIVEGAVLRSRGREEFTTFGHDINFAQRVQSSAKAFESRMAVGPKLRQASDSAGFAEEPRMMELKGFEGLHPVWEVRRTHR